MKGGRLLWVNPCAGVAGDMFVGALLDLGVHLDILREGLASLGIEELEVDVERVLRSGITASRYRVYGPEGGPGHKTWRDIRGVLERADLSDTVRGDAQAVFRLLFEAEARVHGATLETVHLHEAGGWDALADVVGACLGLEALEVGRILSGPVNVGRGLVSTSHGTYPLPAPAAAECLKDARVFSAGPDGEAATPTGAAILGALAGFLPAGAPAGLLLEEVGYGAGARDPKGFANVLPAYLGREIASPAAERDLALLEANLDDCDPRTLGRLLGQLLAAGALDAWHTPIQMKKGRPAVQVSVLARPEGIEAARALLFAETTTLGVRVQGVDRWVLDRSTEKVETPWGPVAVKVGRQGEDVLTVQPEFEDCARLADRHGVPVKEVVRHALAAWTRAREPVEHEDSNEGNL